MSTIDTESTDDELVFNTELLLNMADVDSLSFPATPQLLQDPCVWICDTGASVDSTRHKNGIENRVVGTDEDGLTFGNGDTQSAQAIGEMPGIICNKHGEQLRRVRMTAMHIVEGAKYNLFSATKLMKNKWKLGGDETCITLTKGEFTITFDIVIHTPKGMIFAIYITREGTTEIGNATTDIGVRMNIQTAHHKYGHMSEEITRATAKGNGVIITRGGLKPCASCAAGKAKQRNLPADGQHEKATDLNGRVFSDIATVKPPKAKDSEKQITVAKKNWHMMVDEKTGLKFSHFYAKKSDMVEPTCEQFSKWDKAGKPVKILRQDNAGENLELVKRLKSKDWKLNVVIEYTARDTPQQNSLVEVGFATIAKRGRAMMQWANIPKVMRYKLWPYAFGCATDLDGLVTVKLNGQTKTRYEHWLGKNPRFATNLRTFGEAGTVKVKTAMMQKIVDRGVQCMFVGYAKQHDGNVYYMYNPVTNSVRTTRDVIWMHRKFFPNPVQPAELLVTDFDIEVGKGDDDPNPAAAIEQPDEANADEDSDANADGTQVEDVEEQNSDDDDDDDDAALPVTTTRSGRISSQPARLIETMVPAIDYECVLSAAEEKYYTIMREVGVEAGKGFEMACVGASVGSGFLNTQELQVMKFKEAMNGPDSELWMKAVEEEHDGMVKYKVWKAVLRTEIPRHHKALTSTWAMKKKPKGARRARINVHGFKQVDGMHYDDDTNSSPVVNDTTIRIVLVLAVMARWYASVIDVKGAFLQGKFEEDDEKLYMEVPEEFERHYAKDMVLLLLRPLHGLKQASLMFWHAFLQAMKQMIMQQSKADPCMYFKWNEEQGLLIWVSWIDDCLNVGPKSLVEASKVEFQTHFECEDLGKLDEYVGCKIDYNPDEGYCHMRQPVLLQSLADEFTLPGGKVPKTPAIPGTHLTKGKTEDLVNNKEHADYRKGVGKLIHLMKWTRSDTLNATRELTRMVTAPTGEHMKAMYRVMEYCLGTPNRGRHLAPKRRWDGKDRNFEFIITGTSDSDYAKCTGTLRIWKVPRLKKQANNKAV